MKCCELPSDRFHISICLKYSPVHLRIHPITSINSHIINKYFLYLLSIRSMVASSMWHFFSTVTNDVVCFMSCSFQCLLIISVQVNLGFVCPKPFYITGCAFLDFPAKFQFCGVQPVVCPSL